MLGRPCEREELARQGLGSQCDQSPQAPRESSLEMRTKDGEKLHVIQNSAGYRACEGARGWRLCQAKTRKAVRNLDTVDMQKSTRLLPDKTLTSIQGQLKAILALEIHISARMRAWERLDCAQQVVVTTKTWLVCGAMCSGPRKALLLSSDRRTSHRDTLLVRQDAQLLEWARLHSSSEVAAVSAAEETRRKLLRGEGDQRSGGTGSERTWRILLSREAPDLDGRIWTHSGK